MEDEQLLLVQSLNKLPLDVQALCYPVDNLGRCLLAGLKVGLQFGLLRPDPSQGFLVGVLDHFKNPSSCTLRKILEEGTEVEGRFFSKDTMDGGMEYPMDNMV